MNDVYYNEFDPNAAAWIRNLGEGGHILRGIVDERSIKDVDALELIGLTKAHFFAGIGGWDYALSLAGWGDEEVWTGSCPCQPYSSAGKQKGNEDERNLWPDFFRLIAERRPQFIFGEQVASAIKHGWLDRVYADLEGIGYTCGSAVLGAHSVGANHIRQRLYWGAHLRDAEPERGRCDGGKDAAGGNVIDGAAARRQEGTDRIADDSSTLCLGEDAASLGRGRGRDGDSAGDAGQIQAQGLRADGGIPHRYLDGPGEERKLSPGCPKQNLSPYCTDGGIPNNNNNKGLEVRGEGRPESDGSTVAPGRSPWSDFRLVLCTDGKARRTGARVFPLAYGLPRGVGDGGAWRKGLARSASKSRIGMLKGSGNAIVPELAAVFIRAFRDAVENRP